MGGFDGELGETFKGLSEEECKNVDVSNSEVKNGIKQLIVANGESIPGKIIIYNNIHDYGLGEVTENGVDYYVLLNEKGEAVKQIEKEEIRKECGETVAETSALLSWFLNSFTGKGNDEPKDLSKMGDDLGENMEKMREELGNMGEELAKNMEKIGKKSPVEKEILNVLKNELRLNISSSSRQFKSRNGLNETNLTYGLTTGESINIKLINDVIDRITSSSPKLTTNITNELLGNDSTRVLENSKKIITPEEIPYIFMVELDLSIASTKKDITFNGNIKTEKINYLIHTGEKVTITFTDDKITEITSDSEELTKKIKDRLLGKELPKIIDVEGVENKAGKDRITSVLQRTLVDNGVQFTDAGEEAFKYFEKIFGKEWFIYKNGDLTPILELIMLSDGPNYVLYNIGEEKIMTNYGPDREQIKQTINSMD